LSKFSFIVTFELGRGRNLLADEAEYPKFVWNPPAILFIDRRRKETSQAGLPKNSMMEVSGDVRGLKLRAADQSVQALAFSVLFCFAYYFVHMFINILHSETHDLARSYAPYLLGETLVAKSSGMGGRYQYDFAMAERGLGDF